MIAGTSNSLKIYSALKIKTPNETCSVFFFHKWCLTKVLESFGKYSLSPLRKRGTVRVHSEIALGDDTNAQVKVYAVHKSGAQGSSLASASYFYPGQVTSSVYMSAPHCRMEITVPI